MEDLALGIRLPSDLDSEFLPICKAQDMPVTQLQVL